MKLTHIQALIANGTLQKWECQRFLNNRGNVLIKKIGRIFWNMETKKQVTQKELLVDGWKKVWSE